MAKIAGPRSAPHVVHHQRDNKTKHNDKWQSHKGVEQSKGHRLIKWQVQMFWPAATSAQAGRAVTEGNQAPRKTSGPSTFSKRTDSVRKYAAGQKVRHAQFSSMISIGGGAENKEV